MRMWIFARRNTKEILRDPINLAFGLGFPLALLLLLTALQSGVPVALFALPHLTPGIAVFGLSFITLFSATVIAKDRTGAFLQRLYTTPMTPMDFILGYTVPMVPLSLAQTVICYGAAVMLGMQWRLNMLWCVVFMLPVSVVYIAIGLLCGSVFSDKQVGGICGGLLTNLSAWLAGIWFDLDLVGGVFKEIAEMLPFFHAVELQRAVLAGDFGEILPHLLWVLGYAVGISAAAVWCFLRQMKG